MNAREREHMLVERYIPIELYPDEELVGPAFFSVMLFDAGRQLLAAARDEFVVWDMETRSCTYVEEIRGTCLSEEVLFPLTAGPAQTFATTWAKGDFAIWSLSSFERLRVFEGHRSHVYHAVFLDETEVVSCSGDATLRRWRVATGECLQTRETHVAHRMADSRVGRIAVGGVGAVELVERATLRPIAVYPLPFEPTPFNASVPTHQRRGGVDASPGVRPLNTSSSRATTSPFACWTRVMEKCWAAGSGTRRPSPTWPSSREAAASSASATTKASAFGALTSRNAWRR